MDVLDRWARKVRAFLAGLDIMRGNLEEIETGDGAELMFLAEIVVQQPPWEESKASEVRRLVDALHRGLFCAPGFDGPIIPVQWWQTDIGRLCSWGLLWADRDEAITITAAADRLGVNLSAVSNWLDQGRLRALVDVDARNPQRGRRLVSGSEVEELKRKLGK